MLQKKGLFYSLLILTSEKLTVVHEKWSKRQETLKYIIYLYLFTLITFANRYNAPQKVYSLHRSLVSPCNDVNLSIYYLSVSEIAFTIFLPPIPTLPSLLVPTFFYWHRWKNPPATKNHNSHMITYKIRRKNIEIKVCLCTNMTRHFYLFTGS